MCLLTGTSTTVADKLKARLMGRIAMTNLGEASLVRGMSISHDRNKRQLWLDQRKYTWQFWRGLGWVIADLHQDQDSVWSCLWNLKERYCWMILTPRHTRPKWDR